jgi:hypothetical protein
VRGFDGSSWQHRDSSSHLKNNRKRTCPAGTTENSPQFQLRDLNCKLTSPAGAAEILACPASFLFPLRVHLVNRAQKSRPGRDNSEISPAHRAGNVVPTESVLKGRRKLKCANIKMNCHLAVSNNIATKRERGSRVHRCPYPGFVYFACPPLEQSAKSSPSPRPNGERAGGEGNG